MKLALFDFDGTVTNRDSLKEFVKFVVGKPKYYWGLLVLSPVLAAYLFKVITNSAAKERLIAYFFKDWNYEVFQKKADQYSLEQIDSILRPQAMDKISWHLKEGHQVVIVSASVDCWLQKWCDLNHLELVSTQLEIKNGKLTGRFLGKNCHGVEKVKRVEELYSLDQYQFIYAYGDSSGDRPLMSLAQESHYKPFRSL